MSISLRESYMKKDMQIEALTKKQEEMENKSQQILTKMDTGKLG
jgi:hypothetical protein